MLTKYWFTKLTFYINLPIYAYNHPPHHVTLKKAVAVLLKVIFCIAYGIQLLVSKSSGEVKKVVVLQWRFVWPNCMSTFLFPAPQNMTGPGTLQFSPPCGLAFPSLNATGL